MVESAVAIKPQDAYRQHKVEVIKAIPDFVIEAVNALLIEKMSHPNVTLTIYQKEVRSAIAKTNVDNIPWDQKWLDFEDIYRNQGWQVSYNKVHYSETGDDSYRFCPNVPTFRDPRD